MEAKEEEEGGRRRSCALASAKWDGWMVGGGELMCTPDSRLTREGDLALREEAEAKEEEEEVEEEDEEVAAEGGWYEEEEEDEEGAAVEAEAFAAAA